MTHAGASTQVVVYWHRAMHRGAILGGVASLHLVVLLLLLHLPPCRPAPLQQRAGEFLRIRFLPLPARPPSARHEERMAKPLPAMPRRAVASTRSQRTTNTSTPPIRAIDVTAPISHAETSDYRPGTFDTDLLHAQGARKVRLPGFDAPLRTGIRLQARSSMKDVVHAMTIGNRCKYERMKMQRSTTQFITPQLMDRALDADGCGPQGERNPHADVIEAATRRAILGD